MTQTLGEQNPLQVFPLPYWECIEVLPVSYLYPSLPGTGVAL